MAMSWFFSTSEFILIPVFLLLMIGAIAVGHFIGLSTKGTSDDSSRSFSFTILGGSLGLLGLILGFTFSMAVARYDAGKAQLVNESNAVGTAFLRSRALTPQDQIISRDLYLRYAEALIAHYNSGVNQEVFNASVGDISKIQTELWSHAVEVAQKKPDMVPTGIYMQALNDVIDQSGLRLNYLQYRVPEIVYFLLFATAILTLGLAGYVSGLAGTRRFWATSVLAVVIAIVIGVIVDLDRPKRGFIKVDNARLEELKSGISSWK